MILDGKVTAAALEKDIRERIDVLKERGCTLKLAVILAGEQQAFSYVCRVYEESGFVLWDRDGAV